MKNTKLSIKSFCASVLAAITIVSAMIPAVQAKAFNEIGYEVQKVRYESENDHDDLFYSDGYFSAPSTKYNEHLAALSMAMTKYSMNIDNPENKNDTGWYEKQSDRVKKFYDLIGFQDFAVNEDYRTRTAFDTIGIAAASRKLDDCTVIAATVRSGGYFLEWANNVYLGDGSKSDYMHEGWFNAAHKVVDFLQEYITNCQIEGRIKLWIAGYSRGGAVSNLVSKRVVDTYDPDGTRIYAYPMAVPMGGVESAIVPGNNYGCIHNTINQNDLITYMGTTEMGLIRYGVDHYVPGNPETNATIADWNRNKVPEENYAWNVGTSEYKTYRDRMLEHAAAIAPELVFDDYFHRATVNYVTGAALKNFGWKMVDETGNGGWTTESFVRLFLQKLQEYALSFAEDGDYRTAYAGTVVANGRTFQQALALLVRLAFAKAPEDLEGIMGVFGGLINRLSMKELANAYSAVTKYSAPSVVSDSVSFRAVSNMVWKKITKLSSEDEAAGYHAISEYLTEEEMKELESCFDALMLPVFELIAKDYDKYDQDLIGTMAYNAVNLITNHYPETMIAWLRAYDPFFAEDLSIVEMDPPVMKKPGSIAVLIRDKDGNENTIKPDGSAIEVESTDSVLVYTVDENGESNLDTGEAIYYKVEDKDDYWRAISRPLAVGELFAKAGSEDEVLLKIMPMHYSMHAEEKEQELVLKLKEPAPVDPPAVQEKVVSVFDTELTLPYGTSESEIPGALPTTLFAYLESGKLVTVDVRWTRISTTDADPERVRRYRVSGELVSDKYDISEVTPRGEITLLGRPRTEIPSASIDSGSYTGILNVSLIAEEGAKIYVARPEIDEETSYADLENASFAAYEGPITLNEYDKTLYLAAYAQKDGLAPSDIVVYSYELTKPEVQKLGAAPAMIAENGNVECWYSFEIVKHYEKEEENVVEEEAVPLQYFADEACTRLLETDEVVLPAFVKASYTMSGETDPNLAGLGFAEPVTYNGLQMLGVQAIADSTELRVLTVVDSRILRDATDYGYLFADTDEEEEEEQLTFANAKKRVSLKGTTNSMEGGFGNLAFAETPYKYVTARVTGQGQTAAFYVKLENDVDYIYSASVVVTPEIESQPAMDKVEDNYVENAPAPAFRTEALALAGRIGLIFYMELPEIEGVDYSTSRMTFSIPHGTCTESVSYAERKKNHAGTCDGFACFVNSIQMAEPVTATFHYTQDGVEKRVVEICSVKDYFAAFDREVEKGTITNPDIIALVKAVADYGHYVQPFLAETNHWTLGKDYAEQDRYYTMKYDVDAIKAPAIHCEDQTDGDIAEVSHSLTLDSDTVINVYFRPGEGYSGIFKATVDGGEEAVYEKAADGRYCVKIPGIAAHRLSSMHTIAVTTADGHTLEVTVSALSYVNLALDYYQGTGDLDKKAQNAVASLYAYAEAADAYIEKNS